ncbi:unnamed protein product [Durusdinium trenchii]|uniref:Erythroid differentiation-related factor 1 n=1 Tax=Durusdinium trenchii TaxID=1381693 RepID=A0ABP0KL32_9DINO
MVARFSRKYEELLAEDDESEVLFDACRFPRPTGDLLDHIIGEEPWQNAETCDGQKIRIIGEAVALKRLFELPLQAAGEALCLHRIGDCLVVMQAPSSLDETEDLELLGCQGSPRVRAPGCQVRIDGDMVRIFPVLETAEPVQTEMPTATSPTAACCEWRVREGMSLMALVPRQMSSGDSGLADLSRSSQLRLLDAPSWPTTVNTLLTFDSVAGSLVLPHEIAKSRPSLPEYHRKVTEDKAAVLVVPLNSPLETRTLIDSWLSCCLYGSPSLLCFFVDADGICRGCRFVLAADIPYLEDIAKAYKTNEQKCLREASPAFDPRSLRESSHSLLETLTRRCDQDGGHFLLLPSPIGPRLVRTASYTDDLSEDENEAPAHCGLRTLPSPETQCFQPKPQESNSEPGGAPRMRAALVTQGLLMYHAAVRLAQVYPEQSKSMDLKRVPVGARWTAKSCCHPLRVRQMMLRSVRALWSASHLKDLPVPLPRRFQLLLSSAHEFLADSFFAEEVHGDSKLDIARNRAALSHLQKSKKELAEYARSGPSSPESKFARSIEALEERINAKAVNAHMCLARLYQLQPWQDQSTWRNLGLAMKELDAAEELVAKPNRVTQVQRAAGPYECSLLASISKWKADHLHELATLVLPSVAPGLELEEDVRDYLEAQQRESDESLQALPTQCERWLQSTVSLCLRALHQLAAVPNEVASELQVQARFLLARAYSKLGHLYASTGRFTKAMTHAKQGIELFNATKDKLEAARLQLWLCRLQLRMALPQAPSSSLAECFGLIKDGDLLCGIQAASTAESTALRQVVQQLQKSLNALDPEVAEERRVQADGQALLGRVILRQALVKLAKAPAPFNTCSRLCEEEGSLFSALELLQIPEASNSFEGSDVSKEAVEHLHQAISCFRSAESSLCGLVHTCLAYAYFCGRADPRIHRLSLTHCQHALEQMQDQESQVVVATRLLEAKVTRHTLRSGQKGQSQSWAGDAKAASILCNVALMRFKSIPALQPMTRGDGAETGCPVGLGECTPERMRTALLTSGDESGEVIQLMAYLRQELSSILLRLLKVDLEECLMRELKTLYCSLLTAWHAEAGQVWTFADKICELRF